MSTLSALVAALAFAASGQSGSAELKFVSEGQPFIGTVYGLDAIDSQQHVFGERAQVDVAPGRRTVWYSCPNEPETSGGSRITYVFEAGHRYELVCHDGKEAEIRQSDEC